MALRRAKEKKKNHHEEGKGASRYAFFYKIIFALILCVIHFKIGLYTYRIKFFRTCITPYISLPSQKNINIVLPHASYTHFINPSFINLSLIPMQSSTFHLKPLRQPCAKLCPQTSLPTPLCISSMHYVSTMHPPSLGDIMFPIRTINNILLYIKEVIEHATTIEGVHHAECHEPFPTTLKTSTHIPSTH